MVNKQDYTNAIIQNIEIVRGDTLAFNFELTGLGSENVYKDLAVTFAVVEQYDGAKLVEVTKANGITLESYDSTSDTALFSVCVAPSMTKTLDVARYYYDLQIKDTENVLTLMRGDFTLVYDVAD